MVAATGDIIAVNDAWERFALENGGEHVGVGANYFEACASSDDPVAHDVLRGLRGLLAGALDAYDRDYPCHAPNEQRWMRLYAQRHPGTEQPLLILQHAVITDDRLETNRRLARANERLRAMTDRMGEGLCTLDHEGRITYVNPQGEHLLQAGGIRALGGSFVNRLIGTNSDGTFRSDDELLIGAEFDGTLPLVPTEDQLLRPDGSRLPIEYVVTDLPAMEEGQPDGYVVVFRDISERKERELATRQRSEHATWMSRVQDALDNDRFVLYAQPIVDLVSMETVQHELLIRMDDPEEGLVAPGRFLPTAEAFGMAPAIDRWVIAQGLEIAATGRAVELNLSARSLTDPSLPHVIAEELARTGADPSLVVFEITETALIENDTAAMHFAQRLRVMGCRLALDDFGTGYSGFTYLKHLPIDVLKIDREFVK
ncbi:MAG: EAL domain-containing protein, partial [Actinomycetota bacterium]